MNFRGKVESTKNIKLLTPELESRSLSITVLGLETVRLMT